ncbi:glycosyl transferase (plasmid) [Deltaproteobacteria bacterium Smac51]|nr:glycosyl transferase [Deltaproteobacteria bacterium Smac51]
MPELEKLKAEVETLKEEVRGLVDELDYVRYLHTYYYHKTIPAERYRQALESWYFLKTGRELNLDEPRTFNEKIQWLKLYDSTALKTRLADKYLAREWLADKAGPERLTPLLGVWNRFSEIDFQKLPKKFALKTNHGSGWYMLSDGSGPVLKGLHGSFDLGRAEFMFNRWMGLNYGFYSGLELHYAGIRPKIIAEEYIGDEAEIFDYKILCFGGRALYLWVERGKSRLGTHTRDVFDAGWNRQPAGIHFPTGADSPPRPRQLEEMLALAEKLSAGFPFVRVDCFIVRDKIYIGEMTFTSDSGIAAMPEDFNLKLGELITLPEPSFNFIPKN